MNPKPPQSSTRAAGQLSNRTLISVHSGSTERVVQTHDLSGKSASSYVVTKSPDDDLDRDYTSKIIVPTSDELVNASPEPMSFNRDEIVEPSVHHVDPHVIAPAASNLDRLMDALNVEDFPAISPLYIDISVGDPFEGMMRNTLEMKIDPAAILGLAPNATKTPTEDGLRWLTPSDDIQPTLPNSYGLSDRDVSAQCLLIYANASPTSEDALMALGCIARLEASIVDAFVDVGEAYLRLAVRVQAPSGLNLKRVLEPLELFQDPDLVQAYQLYQEKKHAPEFWKDDDGTGRKSVRLIGSRLLRRHGDELNRLRPSDSLIAEELIPLQLKIDEIRVALNERQQLIMRYYPRNPEIFATSFLVQRGIHKRPGFFWADLHPEEL